MYSPRDRPQGTHQCMAEVFGFDCYSPQEIAQRVENVGVTKAKLPLLSQVALGVLAGGFIGLGGAFSTLVLSDGTLGLAASRVLAGVAFSLGLILVVIAGAELFTGNNLLVMALVSGRIQARQFFQNLLVIFAANAVGALGLAFLVTLSGVWKLGGGAVGKTVVAIAITKCALPFTEAFFRGVLCNVLVCLAVWLAMAGRTVTDKIVAIVFPITAFVACGFEHSIANLYLIPAGILLHGQDLTGAAGSLGGPDWLGLLRNLIPVTLGNLFGGAGMVGLVYWVIYRRSLPRS